MFNLFSKSTPTQDTLQATPRQLTNRLLAWLAVHAQVGAQVEWQFPDGTVVTFSKDTDCVLFLVDSAEAVFYGLKMYEAIEQHFASIA